MTYLTVVEILGQRHYRLNLASTTGYEGAGADAIVAAPVIHTYSAWSLSIISGLALQEDHPMITMGGKQYQVKKFLTAQHLNSMSIEDEGTQGFMPTIKPHYAIAPHNAKGSIYNQHCKTLVEESESGVLLHNRPMPVHVHDGLVSPAVEIKTLKDQLIQAVKSNQSNFYSSYVIDEKNKQLLVTEHCLLAEKDYQMIFAALDFKARPTLEDLISADTSIQAALGRFFQPVEPTHRLIQAVFSGSMPSPVTAGAAAAAEAAPASIAGAEASFFHPKDEEALPSSKPAVAKP